MQLANKLDRISAIFERGGNLFPPVRDNAARVFKGVDPQAAPFGVVGQFAGWVAAGAGDEGGVAGAAGGLAGGLVAQVE